MTKDEALDLALEALEYIENNYMSLPKSGSEAITAIKQARSAPVQEPVAIVDEDGVIVVCNYKYKPGDKLYTTPPGGRQSSDCLTAAQEDIQRLSALVRAQQITIDKLEQARSAPVQEPVAYRSRLASGSYTYCNTPQFFDNAEPLYTAAPAAQRQWTGLTDEDKLMCWARATHDADVEHKTEHQCLMDYGTEIEAKLRSKNDG
jgi:hypothetical protein